MDFDALLKEAGLDLSTMDFDAKDGAQSALGDIICARGEEAELGLTADPMGGGVSTKPDPRLNIPKKKDAASLNKDTSMDSDRSSSSDDTDDIEADTDQDADGNSNSKSNSSTNDTDTTKDDSDDNKETGNDSDEDDSNKDPDADEDSSNIDDADSDDLDSDNSNDTEDDEPEEDDDSDDVEDDSEEEDDDNQTIEDEESDEDEEDFDEEDSEEDEEDDEESEESEDDELSDEDDLDELDNIDDPDALDPAKEERRRRIGRLRQVLSQAEDVITGGPKTESLHESAEDDLKEIQRLKKVLDTAEDLSEEEFEAIEDEILKLTSRHVKLSVLSKEEKEKRLKRFKDEMSDQDVLDALEAEDNENRRKEHKQLSTDEKRRQQIHGRPSLGGFAEFKNSLYKAIARQVSRGTQSERTWMRPDKHNTNPDIAKKGVRKNNLIKSIPSIDFYFDQSGSWDDADINTGNKAVALLQDMERQKKLNINIYYFSNALTTDPNDSCLRGGTHAWAKIIAKIKENGATNVVIMTDADMDYQAENGSTSCVVPGYVWYLWKNGERAASLPKNLVGKHGTLEFKFTTGD